MLIQRIITAGVFGCAVVAAIVWLPSVWVGILLGALWLVGVNEWSHFANLGRGAAIAWIAAHAAAMLVTGIVFPLEGRSVTIVLSVSVLWWATALILLFFFPRKFAKPTILAAGVATLLPSWMLLAWLHGTVANGPLLILALLAVVWSADTGAYFTGRTFGRHRLAPRVSPGKTWEGVCGGLLLAGCVGAVVGGLSGVGSGTGALLAVVTAAVSIIGDLTVSMFKRNAGLKDSGRLLPGHGGVLDRVDSLTAAVAMFVLGLLIAGIIT